MDGGYAAELEQHMLLGCNAPCCGVSSEDEDDEDDLDYDIEFERESQFAREDLQDDLENELARRDSCARKKIQLGLYCRSVTDSQSRKAERVKLVKAGIDGYKLTWKHPRRSLRWDWREQMLDMGLIGEEEAAISEWEARQPQTVHLHQPIKRREEPMPTLDDFLRLRPGEEEAFSDGFGDVSPLHIINNMHTDAVSAFGIN